MNRRSFFKGTLAAIAALLLPVKVRVQSLFERTRITNRSNKAMEILDHEGNLLIRLQPGESLSLTHTGKQRAEFIAKLSWIKDRPRV